MSSFSSRPIRSIMVANRGEIAVRVLRTCRRLGYRSVAAYSDADAEAPHVRLADEAVCIGAAPARDSYLNIRSIIDAAGRMDADAIHPGYGFLSENADFASACEEAGVIFIGPSPKAIALMGSKIESKRIAEAAGIATVPGYHRDAQDADILQAAAAKIGYPILIKASAGGGGRGMRRVDRAEDFPSALEIARNEAEAAFGDASVLLEKLVSSPRHIEVQIAGDKLGNLVHLFDRDCSVQRNNQKVLEEAPAPNLSLAVRKKLHDSALSLGRRIGYDSVGTVEFIMEEGGEQPYFLEMNTRLQVEHPVTEAITGIDLVEWQIRVAAGEPLPLRQEQIRLHGHAIEARLTAERADLGFQPVTGRITRLRGPGKLRFDSGVVEGSEIGLYYDSLLAKLIAQRSTREGALLQLEEGLRTLALLGLPSNQLFLRDAIRHPIFAQGRATTGFIEAAFPNGWRVNREELFLLRAAGAAAWLAGPGPSQNQADWQNPWLSQRPVRVTGTVRAAQVSVELEDEYGSSEVVLHYGRNAVDAEVDGVKLSLGRVIWAGDTLTIAPHGIPESLLVHRTEDMRGIAHQGLAINMSAKLKSEALHSGLIDSQGGNRVEAPLHGLITHIHVAVGDNVEAGMALVQMEAMKLVHTLSAPRAGIVANIRHAVGEIVTAGVTLIELDALEVEEMP